MRGTHVRLGATVVAVAALMISLVGVALSAGGGEPAQAEKLRDIELRRLQALVDADMEVAERLHADDFHLIPPPGEALLRDEYLAAVAAGDIDYLVFEPVSEIEVRFYGQAAALRYISQIDIEVTGIGTVSHEVWHTYVYEKRNGQWQAVWEQATGIGGFPPPPPAE